MKQTLSWDNVECRRCFNHSDLDTEHLNQNSFGNSPASESCTFAEWPRPLFDGGQLLLQIEINWIGGKRNKK